MAQPQKLRNRLPRLVLEKLADLPDLACKKFAVSGFEDQETVQPKRFHNGLQVLAHEFRNNLLVASRRTVLEKIRSILRNDENFSRRNQMLFFLKTVDDVAFGHDGDDHETAERFGKPGPAAALDLLHAERIKRKFIRHGHVPDFMSGKIRILKRQRRPAGVFPLSDVRHVSTH